MTVVALVWSWATVVCLAWGTVAGAGLERLAAAPRPAAPLPLAVTCWLGLVVVTTLAGVISLAHAIDHAVALGISGAGLGALALARGARDALAARLRRAWRALGRPLVALAVVVVLVALAEAAGPPTNYDTGLYHAQAIRWIESHPAPPGLGNLHGRFALGSTWFLAEATFGSAALAGPPRHVMVGCVFVWTALHALGGLALLGRGRATLAVVVRIASLPLALLLARHWVSSPSPDLALAVLVWTIAALALGAPRDAAPNRLDRRDLAIAVLAAFAVCTKATAAPLLLLPAATALTRLRRRRRAALAVVALVLVVGAPHVARTVVLSGYPAYPVPLLPPLPVDWAIPPDAVVRQAGWIASWARMPGRSPREVLAMPVTEWVGPWFARRTPLDRLLLGAIPLLALAALPGARRPAHHPLVWVALGSGTLLWFVGAPDPRFGWGYYPIVALGLAARVGGRLAARLPRRGTALALAAAIAALALWPHAGRDARAALAARLLVPASYPERPLRTVRIDADLTVLAPERGDQCWNAPLPCTPYPAPSLERRGPALADGFRWGAPGT